MIVCPGHELDDALVDKSLKEIRTMRRNGIAFEQIARFVSRQTRALGDYHNPTRDSPDEYASAAAARDWIKADTAYLDACRRKQPGLYHETLRVEGVVRAFNLELKSKFDESETLLRWMSADELESYLAGTFESRKEDDGTRRGYKAFSLVENGYAGNRPAVITVPIDSRIRKVVRISRYTALPRKLWPKEERFYDDKHAIYAYETECRIPDGTPVPDGASVKVRLDMLDSTVDVEKLKSVCGALGIKTDLS